MASLCRSNGILQRMPRALMATDCCRRSGDLVLMSILVTGIRSRHKYARINSSVILGFLLGSLCEGISILGIL